MSEVVADEEQDSLDVDWKILRRGYEVTKTMNLAEGVERLTRALTYFFDEEGIFKKLLKEGDPPTKAKPPHKFHVYLIQEPRQKSSRSLVWRFMIDGVNELEMFTEATKSPFFNEIDEAFEWLFNRVVEALTQYETEFEELVQSEEAKLADKKARLMRFKRLKQERGQFDPYAPSLPFEADPKDVDEEPV